MPCSTKNWFVAIGASGPQGLDDIIRLLGAMPADSAAIFMVVLHRPSNQKSELLHILQRCCAMPVRIAEQAEELQPGVCYIGEPAEHLTLMSQGRADMIAGAKDAYRNRTVDLLLASIARIAKHRAIGVILSGALDDGSRGLAEIHAAGGVTMVLQPCVTAHGMQQNAIEYDGPVTRVGTSEELAREICRLVAEPISGLCGAE